MIAKQCRVEILPGRLSVSTNAFFFARFQRLSCFSRAIAKRHRVIFVVDKPIEIVSARETLDDIMPMLPNTTFKAVRDTDIQHDSAAIGHHIDEERLHRVCEILRPSCGGSG